MVTRCPGSVLAVSLFLVLGACSGAASRHLQYDYGRAFTATTTAQADLTRPSVVNLEHPLQGVEAQAIRLRVEESTTDVESGDATLEQ
ncbi:MAG: hypothetical protein JRI25_00970 [Deltaproteobacteria bacterium]|nr:hypothetical protein [Deltaproteobacteria bacterium]